MANQLYCNNFENRIQNLMDQRSPLCEDALVQSHAKQCKRCHELLESFSALEFALNEVFLVGDFDAAIRNPGLANQCNHYEQPLSTFALQLPEQNHKTARWMVVGFSLAIAVVLMLLIPTVMTSDRSIADDGKKGIAIAALDVDDQAIASAVDSKQPEVTEADVVSEPVGFGPMGMYESLPLSLRSAYGYAAQLPGIRPLEYSFTVTLEMIQKSFDQFSGSKQRIQDPDLGHFIFHDGSRMV